MHDVDHYGLTVLFVSVALFAAVVSTRLSSAIRIPAPAIFLAVAAVASLVPQLGSLPVVTDQRIVTIALIIILFDGGTSMGLRRFSTAATAIVWVGVAGTVVTAGALAACAHLLLGFDWTAALLVGTALAPTDPAVVFSVLGGQEIAGRQRNACSRASPASTIRWASR